MLYGETVPDQLYANGGTARIRASSERLDLKGNYRLIAIRLALIRAT
jgi:hypothetical protein